MEFLKSRRVTSKLAMGLLLGSTLISASIAGPLNRSNCTPPVAPATTTSCSDFSKGNCTTSAQYAPVNNTTSGWYPCYLNVSTSGSACSATSNNNAYCAQYQCTTTITTCASFTNEGSCLSSLISSDGITGTQCTWSSADNVCSASSRNTTIQCNSDTPKK